MNIRSVYTKWHSSRWRLQERDSSKEGNQNQNSNRGITPNVKEGAGRLLQQNRHMADDFRDAATPSSLLEAADMMLARTPGSAWAAISSTFLRGA
jgi:hypothetical protein